MVRLLAAFLFLIPVLALAEAINGIPPELSNVKATGALGIAIAVTQFIMLLVNKFGDMAGKWKFLIMSGTSMVMTFLGQMAVGNSWLTALLSGAVITAIQNFVHQAIKQSSEKAPSK